MAVVAGTIKGVSLLSATKSGAGERKAYAVTVDFAAYTGASDTMSVAAVGAGIASRVANGKTNTLVGAVCSQPGLDTAAQEVYTGTLTVSTDDLTGNLTNSAGVELTSATASKGVELIVVVTES